MSNSNVDYVNEYLDSIYTQLHSILDSCNDIFSNNGISPATQYLDLPDRISDLAALVPTPEPEPEPAPDPEPGNNEEPNESEEENNG